MTTGSAWHASRRGITGPLVGNWKEEVDQRRAYIAELLEKKKRGELRSDIKDRYVSTQLTPLELTAGHEDSVSFGDVLQIVHISGRRLAQWAPRADLASKPTRRDSAEVVGSDRTTPVCRNTYQLQPCPAHLRTVGDEIYEDAAVRYGQSLLISAAASGTYLTSKPLNTSAPTRSSRQQRAFFQSEPLSQALWQIQPVDPELWPEFHGLPVGNQDTVVIVHVGTGLTLCCHSDEASLTDFGVEQEISVHSYHSLNRRNGLQHFIQGDIRGASQKPFERQNQWQLLNKSTESSQDGGFCPDSNSPTIPTT